MGPGWEEGQLPWTGLERELEGLSEANLILFLRFRPLRNKHQDADWPTGN